MERSRVPNDPEVHVQNRAMDLIPPQPGPPDDLRHFTSKDIDDDDTDPD